MKRYRDCRWADSRGRNDSWTAHPDKVVSSAAEEVVVCPWAVSPAETLELPVDLGRQPFGVRLDVVGENEETQAKEGEN
jgi:hypothetical protein